MTKRPIIFVINTGSTSTKCSLYSVREDHVSCLKNHTIPHINKNPNEDISPHETMLVRFQEVSHFFENNRESTDELLAIGALGGMLPPVPSGVIVCNKELSAFSINTPLYNHASNFGAPIAYELGQRYHCDSYIVDPVSVDEMTDIARISGSPLFPRFSFVHALNIRATIRKLCKTLQKEFEHISVVAAHLGGGFSIAAFQNGKIIDCDNRMEGAPFTPERAGGIPPIPLIEACFSGAYTKEVLLKHLYGCGGVYAYLGTKNMKDVVNAIHQNDASARFIYQAMIYQICKEMSAMASVLHFRIDGMIITGGLAFDSYLTDAITETMIKLAPVYVYPGENENEAIAESVALVKANKYKALHWPDCIIPHEVLDPFTRLKKSLEQ